MRAPAGLRAVHGRRGADAEARASTWELGWKMISMCMCILYPPVNMEHGPLEDSNRGCFTSNDRLRGSRWIL